tara:strand:+ start:2174 stop:3196 length:1023 start_codon:yes stop_codon:yes gene_type:complete
MARGAVSNEAPHLIGKYKMHEQKDFFNNLSEITINPVNRFERYTKEHCWQYDIRLNNLNQDLITSGLSKEEAQLIKVSDFNFKQVMSEEKNKCAEIKHFIQRHEWLGKMPMSITHRFTARWKGVLVGVIVMATPNAFSNLLGVEYKNKEKLISRGACISWSPTNTASWLLMQSIKWMVKNTDFRIFTAYSDPEAKELGTIYQACNFYYLGQRFGSVKQYLDPDNLNRGWFGDVGFNDRSQIVRYAKQLGIEWQKEWFKFVGSKNQYRKIDWSAMPDEIQEILKNERLQHKKRCKSRVSAKKHKYAYIKGSNKKETKQLKKLFFETNLNLDVFNYPKERGV